MSKAVFLLQSLQRVAPEAKIHGNNIFVIPKERQHSN